MHAGYWGLGGLVLAMGFAFASTDLSRPPVEQKAPSRAELIVSVQFTPEKASRPSSLAKYEPVQGAYLGAYIDLDPQLPASFVDANGKKRKRPSDFEARVGREHAMYFFYLGYGQPTPIDYLRYLTAQNKYVQIALEPNDGLDQVQEDDYLLNLADDIRQSGAKVFLRFASEMNGDWVNYHGDPELYKEKWKLVTRVMRDRAPNVAMVWCPYALPVSNVMDYYPGDEYVDWVGVNLYNVTFFNQDANSPARDVSPRALLRPIYEMFADRKPIMICEYATTHFSALEKRSVPFFAANNILELYQSLQTEFPRVKAIYYFSSNNLHLAHRRNNNYSLLEDPVVLSAYRKATASEHFLSEPQVTSLADGEPVSKVLKDGMTLTARTRVTAWANATERIEFVRFSINGRPLHTGHALRDWSFVLDATRFKPGKIEITAEAFNNLGEVLASRSFNVTLQAEAAGSAVSN